MEQLHEGTHTSFVNRREHPRFFIKDINIPIELEASHNTNQLKEKFIKKSNQYINQVIF